MNSTGRSGISDGIKRKMTKTGKSMGRSLLRKMSMKAPEIVKSLEGLDTMSVKSKSKVVKHKKIRRLDSSMNSFESSVGFDRKGTKMAKGDSIASTKKKVNEPEIVTLNLKKDVDRPHEV